MGAGASIPDQIDLATAQALAGDAFDAAKFDELKSAEGYVTKEQLLACAPAPAAKKPVAEVDVTADLAAGAPESLLSPIRGTHVSACVDFERISAETQRQAALRFKVENMWKAVEKLPDGTVERLACWDYIMADPEIASLVVSSGNAFEGKQVLAAMKEAVALNISRTGFITMSEFYRLIDCSSDSKYAFHPEDHVSKLVHLSASAGGGMGGLIRSLKTPEGLNGAELVLYKLAQKAALDTDMNQTSGFGNTYQPATINYYRLFKLIDADMSRVIDLDEFNKCLRKALGISSKALSDVEIVLIFEAMDRDKSGTVTLAEFAAFAKGASRASKYHGELGVFQLRGTTSTTGGAEGKGSTPNLCKDGSQLLYHNSDANIEKIAMPTGLSDKAAMSGMAEPVDLDSVHLILWHLGQHVAYKCDSEHSTGNAKEANATHPGNVSYKKLFDVLELDGSGTITRDEWAIGLRKHVGVGPHVSDKDLEQVFDAVDEDHSGAISLREFAAFARGASTSAMARGVTYEVSRNV